MTLLVTLYTSRGIVFAADSSITREGHSGRERVPKQEKFLRTKRLGISGGVVGYFGLACVGDEPMDRWLRALLDAWPGSPRASDLGEHLRDELNAHVPRAHREKLASGFHIGTFEKRDGVAVPVFQYVWNYDDLDVQSGEYSGFGDYEPRSTSRATTATGRTSRRETCAAGCASGSERRACPSGSATASSPSRLGRGRG